MSGPDALTALVQASKLKGGTVVINQSDALDLGKLKPSDLGEYMSEKEAETISTALREKDLGPLEKWLKLAIVIDPNAESLQVPSVK